MPFVAATWRSMAPIASTRAGSYQGAPVSFAPGMRGEARRREPQDVRAGGRQAPARVGHDRPVVGVPRRPARVRSRCGRDRTRRRTRPTPRTARRRRRAGTSRARSGQVSCVRHESAGRSVDAPVPAHLGAVEQRAAERAAVPDEHAVSGSPSLDAATERERDGVADHQDALDAWAVVGGRGGAVRSGPDAGAGDLPALGCCRAPPPRGPSWATRRPRT